MHVQGGSNMAGTHLYVRLYKSVPVIFERPCNNQSFPLPTDTEKHVSLYVLILHP